MTGWRISGVLLGALLALTAIELVKEKEAHAIFGGPLCPDCVSELVVCCPKPCPIHDSGRTAGEAGKLLLQGDLLRSQERTNLEWSRFARIVGAAGARASTQSCPSKPADFLEEPAPEELALESVVRLDDLGSRTSAARLDSLRQSSVSDADRTLTLLAAEMARAAEREALAGDAVQNARDLRDFFRRIAELESSVALHAGAAASARAERMRLYAGKRLTPQPLVETESYGGEVVEPFQRSPSP